MRIYPAPFLLRDDLRALGYQIARRDCQDKTEASERVGIAHERTLELEAIGFIVQEVLFNIKAAALLREGVPVRGLLTHDIPILPGLGVTG